jgi:hypothetical protein
MSVDLELDTFFKVMMEFGLTIFWDIKVTLGLYPATFLVNDYF